ncbi:MAG: tetratricopeptide repeat protein [Thermoanaerobaculia bacterium]|nr:tetratricopeptide repeat protein [Thermoanaerobaculia bacterium]
MITTAQQLEARRKLRKLNLPKEAAAVLEDSSCWSEPFCLAFFDACDAALYEDPRAAFPLAEVAPRLARRVPAESCTPQRRRELETHALAILGGAHRALGRLAEADASYAEALRLIADEPIAAREEANVCRRLAVLRMDQGKFDEALELVRRAVAIYRSGTGIEDRQNLAWALLVEGTVHFENKHSSEAIRLYAEALRHADPRRGPRIYYAALHNLSFALAQGASHPTDLAAALNYLRLARRRLRGNRQSLQRLKHRWAEGIILMKFGSTRRAEAALQVVREGLVELQTPYEVAMVSLDLSSIYLDEGRFGELRSLAAETFALFRSLAIDREASAALVLWQEAVKADKLTDTLLVDVRSTLNRRAAAKR